MHQKEKNHQKTPVSPKYYTKKHQNCQQFFEFFFQSKIVDTALSKVERPMFIVE